MRNINKLVLFFTIILFTVVSVFAGPYNATAKTKRIPAGAVFQLEFLQPVSTFSGNSGDSFVATILNEQVSDSSVILPAGSIVRGCVFDIKSAKYFSRGAKLYLDFDHVVTPTGRQIPLDMAVAQFDKIYYDGGLYKNLGYGEAVKNNYDKAAEMIRKSTEYGKRAGDSAPGIQYLTTPICAFGGLIGGVGYFIGDSIADMFRKGQDLYINTGDIMNVKLINPIDIPVY